MWQGEGAYMRAGKGSPFFFFFSYDHSAALSALLQPASHCV